LISSTILYTFKAILYCEFWVLVVFYWSSKYSNVTGSKPVYPFNFNFRAFGVNFMRVIRRLYCSKFENILMKFRKNVLFILPIHHPWMNLRWYKKFCAFSFVVNYQQPSIFLFYCLFSSLRCVLCGPQRKSSQFFSPLRSVVCTTASTPFFTFLICGGKK